MQKTLSAGNTSIVHSLNIAYSFTSSSVQRLGGLGLDLAVIINTFFTSHSLVSERF